MSDHVRESSDDASNVEKGEDVPPASRDKNVAGGGGVGGWFGFLAIILLLLLFVYDPVVLFILDQYRATDERRSPPKEPIPHVDVDPVDDIVRDDVFFPPVQSGDASCIPLTVIQTYNAKNYIPAKVANNFNKFAPEYARYVYNDMECEDFLRRYFQRKVLRTFHSLKGAHKGDLFRYAVMYVYGGVYLDIKTELLLPLKDVIFNNRERHQATVIPCRRSNDDDDKENRHLTKSDGNLSHNQWRAQLHSIPGNRDGPKRITFTVLSTFISNIIYQGIIATPPGNPIFVKLIHYFVISKKPLVDYQMSIKRIYQLIREDLNYSDVHASYNTAGGTAGLRERGHQLTFDYYFFEERQSPLTECYDGPDRYHKCMFVWDRNVKVFKTRYADYPWDPVEKATSHRDTGGHSLSYKLKEFFFPFFPFYDWERGRHAIDLSLL